MNFRGRRSTRDMFIRAVRFGSRVLTSYQHFKQSKSTMAFIDQHYEKPSDDYDRVVEDQAILEFRLNLFCPIECRHDEDVRDTLGEQIDLVQGDAEKEFKRIEALLKDLCDVDSNEEEKVDEVFAKIIGCQDELSGLLAKIMVKSTSALVNSYLGRTLRMVSLAADIIHAEDGIHSKVLVEAAERFLSFAIPTTSQEEKNEIGETFSRIPGIFGYKFEQVKVLRKIIVEEGGYEVVRKIRSKKGAKKEKAGTGEEKGKGGKGGVKRSSAKVCKGIYGRGNCKPWRR